MTASGCERPSPRARSRASSSRARWRNSSSLSGHRQGLPHGVGRGFRSEVGKQNLPGYSRPSLRSGRTISIWQRRLADGRAHGPASFPSSAIVKRPRSVTLTGAPPELSTVVTALAVTHALSHAPFPPFPEKLVYSPAVHQGDNCGFFPLAFSVRPDALRCDGTNRGPTVPLEAYARVTKRLEFSCGSLVARNTPP
jgi:hypothetical protein